MAKVLNDKKVILGLSGGVDSTAAALSLKAKGYEVIGLYFDIHENNEDGIKKAKKVANEIGIDLIVKNVNKVFETYVIDEFIREYTDGRTPNPCVLCNPFIKFKVLIETADEMGAKFIATGHYANVDYSQIQKCYVLKLAANTQKDQSYMLHRLPENYLARLLLPLAEIEKKEQTREIARQNNLSNADDGESQEICFIDKTETYIDFLEKRSAFSKKGKFIDSHGKILGEHKGISNYTIGQRKGLGITLGKPAFVTSIDNETNCVVLGDNEELFLTEANCDKVLFTSTNSSTIPEFLTDKTVDCKIRYAAKPAKATIKQTNQGIQVQFEEKQRAITPGQWLVIYFDDEVVGGGRII